jgi:hypothetical protein
MNSDDIRKTVDKYYTEKIKEFGAVPRGVDWNGPESQNIRFDQLTKLFIQERFEFSLLDYGCGYGALLSYLEALRLNVAYRGYDLSTEMINVATKSHTTAGAVWISDTKRLTQYDYVVASGIFNVREQTSDKDWEQYLFETLAHINALSLKGFAFNVLTAYSDEEKKKRNLFYASPARLFDYCKSTFSKSVALLHDYPLYEFTVLVRKNVL